MLHHHACGYAMANAGHDTRLIQDWLGHRAIQHTALGVTDDETGVGLLGRPGQREETPYFTPRPR